MIKMSVIWKNQTEHAFKAVLALEEQQTSMHQYGHPNYLV